MNDNWIRVKSWMFEVEKLLVSAGVQVRFLRITIKHWDKL